MISKITLGTVQMGLKYGIANQAGKPTAIDSQKVLQFAYDHGINTFDTAPAYGNSEEIVGHFVDKNSSRHPNIVTKCFFPTTGDESYEELYQKVKDSVLKSLKDLHLDIIPYFLLHHAEDIIKTDGKIAKAIIQLKGEGLLNHIGVSIGKPEDINIFLNYDEFTVIQIPINILDLRLIKMGLLAKLYAKNAIVFARSIFLQGILFMNSHDLPDNLKKAEEYLVKLAEIAKKVNLSIAQLSFCFIRDLKEISSIVMGVDNIVQLKENLGNLNLPPLKESIKNEILGAFEEIDENIIDPSLWRN